MLILISSFAPNQSPLSSTRSRLNHSDLVLSNEDFMLVGRGSVVGDHRETAVAAAAAAAEAAAAPVAAVVGDPRLDCNMAHSSRRVDDDLTSYARSREALQSLCECHSFSLYRVGQ